MPAKLLMIGIHKELKDRHEDSLSGKKIRRFLKAYCRDFRYKDLLVEGAVRVGLDGKEVSKVSKEEIPPKFKKLPIKK